MRKIALSDVLDLTAYELGREHFRAQAMDGKALRRVAVGPLITVFFENRLTLLYQLQEMLRVERVVRPEAIQQEMGVWNDLMPGDDELSLTLMIEETDLARAKDRLHELRDLEPTVSLRFGGHQVHAHFEEGWRDENRISAVQFIRFRLTPGERQDFLAATDVSLAIDHPAYRHAARLSADTLRGLRDDLGTP